MPPASEQDSLGARLRALRAARGWTLKEMSAESGIPFSTLSKIEHDRLSLTYDRLQALARRLSIPVASLFGEAPFDEAPPPILARRSLGDAREATAIALPNGAVQLLPAAIAGASMTPMLYRLEGGEPGRYLSLPGECWLYPTEGAVLATTSHYDPVRLEPGQHLYLDPRLAHGLAVAAGHERAVVIAVCRAPSDQLAAALALSDSV